jgi:hypothetical protein
MTNALKAYKESDGFASTAGEAQGEVVGTQVKFVKGVYFAGTEEIPAGTELVAVATSVGWIRWFDGHIIEKRMRSGNERVPARELLGDHDEKKWEKGPDGKPSDPWRLTRYLYLVEPNSAKDYTFITSSWGGHSAIRDLSRQIEIKRTHQPGANPVVALAAGFKNSAKYGRIPSPRFDVVRWVGGTTASGDGFDTEVAKAVDMNDQIPF